MRQLLLRYEIAFPDFIFRTSEQILTKLAQIHCLEGRTSLLDFGDLDPIFKVTAAFNV